MRLLSFLRRQLGNPSGWFSPVTARFLNRTNARENERCIEALELQPTFRVLDLGFGGGGSFPRLLERCPDGHVAGADVSAEMVARARSNWAREMAAGRLEVVEGSAERLGFPDDNFDRVMTVNTVYFWSDLDAGLAEVQRVLVPGGRFVACVARRERLLKAGFDREGFRTEPPDFYARALQLAGYCDIRVDVADPATGAVLVSGAKPVGG
jgi:arsenite methyltransferase